ncbi:Rieske (2Fe-2S) protein [Brevibacterium ammoniilyticum]|uniref:Rieske (2Fe-2S) protein n=1 Tax=Brevibacterium ammoniilyticum TaxID=1046555 RepID=A0ABP9U6J0_9MICO
MSSPAETRRDGHPVCTVDELAPGQRRIVEVEGRSIGVFNVAGRFYALHNGCPHKGGALCEGPICGTTMPTQGTDFEYGRDGSIVRCAWHGWEFDITTGEALADPKFRARRYPVRVDGEQVVIEL